jgi:hypothetical protein
MTDLPKDAPRRAFGFDSKIEDSITQKREALSAFRAAGCACTANRYQGVLFDELLVIGAPINRGTSPPRPTILVVFPAAPLLLGADEYRRVSSFCFPKGFHATSKRADFLIEQFVFQITSAACQSPVYGICTIVSMKDCRDAFFYGPASKGYPTCLCFLTKTPVFSPVFQYSYFLARWIGGLDKAPLLHSHPIEQPDASTVRMLPHLTLVGAAFLADGFVIRRTFVAELAWARGLRCAVSGDAIERLSRTDSMTIPSQARARFSSLYLGLDILFSRLSVANVVKAVSILLLERHVIVASASLFELSVCCLCLSRLCKPFVLQCIFLPILPRHFLGLLESPVPFICGVVRRKRPVTAPAYVALINLDSDSIVEEDQTPLLPDADRLIEKLTSLFEFNAREILIPKPRTRGFRRDDASRRDFIATRIHKFAAPLSYAAHDRRYIFTLEISEAIDGLFRCQFAPLLERVMQPCFVTDRSDRNPVTVFNQDLFLASVPHREFYEIFVSTTVFNEFADVLMDELVADGESGRRRSSSICISPTLETANDSGLVGRSDSYEEEEQGDL